MDKKRPLLKNQFVYIDTITTRWSDNDIYGHVNNVQYYSYFDTAVNRYLIDSCNLDIHKGDTIGFVVHSSCDYFAPAAYPQVLSAGVRVIKIGNTSVRYQVAIFSEEHEEAIAQGEFVHVYVDAGTHKPKIINDNMRMGLKKIAVDTPSRMPI